MEIKEKVINTMLEIITRYKVFNKRLKTFKSNKFSGNLIVQYNIWLNGNKKLMKKIKKQKIKAKNALFLVNLILSFCLNPPLELK